MTAVPPVTTPGDDTGAMVSGIDYLDLLVADMNGLLRGKRVEALDLDKVMAHGVSLPASVFGANITGDTVEETGLGFAIGDRDLLCRVVPGSLRKLPWGPAGGAQMLLEMCDDAGAPLAYNPRTILQRAVADMHAAGLFPQVAVELEFYLVDEKGDGHGGLLPPVNPVTGRREQNTQVYLMSGLDDFRGFMDTAREYAAAQCVPASGAIAEYAPGQFEINLAHRDDPVAACDDAILLKRLVKQAAAAHGFTATFMAKPFIDQAGSGTHIHASVYDAAGHNCFAADRQLLLHAIGGLQHTCRETMLLCAPHANSYRRFQAGNFVPLSSCWGYNNRTVALRIPAGPEQALRIEHRLAGADANPYLLTALVLRGILHGMRGKLPAGAPITGNAYTTEAPTLTRDWRSAIVDFEASDWVRQAFGAEFHRIYTAIKWSEYEAFQRQVTPLEVHWCLQHA